MDLFVVRWKNGFKWSKWHFVNAFHHTDFLASSHLLKCGRWTPDIFDADEIEVREGQQLSAAGICKNCLDVVEPPSSRPAGF